MYITRKIGPRTVSCGILIFLTYESLISLFILKNCDLSDKFSSSKRRILDLDIHIIVSFQSYFNDSSVNWKAQFSLFLLFFVNFQDSILEWP